MARMINEKGFTALELMVVVAVSTIMMYAMFIVMQFGSLHLETADLTMNIHDNARDGVYKMAQEMRMSAPSKVAIGAGCTSVSFNVPDPNSPVTSGYAISWPGHAIQYSYSSSTRKITRTNSTTGQTSTMGNDVSSAMFTTDTTAPFTCVVGASPSAVSIVLTVQHQLKNGNWVPTTALQIAGLARIRNT